MKAPSYYVRPATVCDFNYHVSRRCEVSKRDNVTIQRFLQNCKLSLRKDTLHLSHVHNILWVFGRSNNWIGSCSYFVAHLMTVKRDSLYNSLTKLECHSCTWHIYPCRRVWQSRTLGSRAVRSRVAQRCPLYRYGNRPCTYTKSPHQSTRISLLLHLPLRVVCTVWHMED